MTEAIFTFLVIAEDGTSHEHHHRMADTDAIDDVVRAAVGGWLEYIRVDDQTLALWCDEEGGLRRRPVNPVGSRLVLLLGGRAAAYVGPIVVTGVRGANTVSLSQEQLDQLLGTCSSAAPDARTPPLHHRRLSASAPPAGRGAATPHRSLASWP